MIDLAKLPDQPVCILGLGRSGLATAEALRTSGKEVWAWDDSEAARAVAVQHAVPLRDLHACDLASVSTLVLSPGIPHIWPEPHPVVARARQAGCEIIGDVELLVRMQTEATFIGVTGTNGKSTTTALIGHILRAAGRTTEIGGNIGVPALALVPLGRGGIYVLELSSYQLELTPSVACDVAVLLNISSDHLGRHGGMDGYVAAKRRIFHGQWTDDTAVIGSDDVVCRAIAEDMRRRAGPRIVAISGSGPREGGIYVEQGQLYEAMAGDKPRMVLALAHAPAMLGEHNAQNVAAALAAVRAVGVAAEVAAEAIKTFPGLPHRQERVGEVDGVIYVNDSKATNPEAAARALACYGAVYWIVGGRPKEGGLVSVLPHLDRVRHAFLIGEAADVFAKELEGRVPATVCGTLDRAVAAATLQARGNGAAQPVVLLSPACASFDQFGNFEERGDAFRVLVEALGP